MIIMAQEEYEATSMNNTNESDSTDYDYERNAKNKDRSSSPKQNRKDRRKYRDRIEIVEDDDVPHTKCKEIGFYLDIIQCLLVFGSEKGSCIL